MKHCLLLFTFLMCANNLLAQNISSNKLTLGFGVGFRNNSMNMSDIVDGEKEKVSSIPFSIFVQKESANGIFSVRPQISFLKRGAKYVGINSDYWSNAEYSVEAKYFDIRLPLILNFGKNIQPYFYVSPIVGFVTNGEISLAEKKGKTISTNVSKGNMNSFYVGAGGGVGVRYKWKNQYFCGLEFMYDYGIIDTYSSTEKDGKSKDIGNLVDYDNDILKGNRKFSGTEIQIVFGIPLGKVKNKPQEPIKPIIQDEPIINEPIIDEPIKEEPQVEVKDSVKTSFELNEINDMIDKGEDVHGKTIRAVNNTINFDFGNATIKPESYPYLDSLAKTLIRTGANIKVSGHTDSVGTDTYNMELSINRVNSVVDYLVTHGINREKITTQGFGARCPISTNDTEEGRAMNRRVEFEILSDDDNK
ncbi:MAG: OmpA family protein [Bacteroidales bacterium]|nr:OmpA family protein [Bacteroidales bacterium]